MPFPNPDDLYREAQRHHEQFIYITAEFKSSNKTLMELISVRNGNIRPKRMINPNEGKNVTI